MAFTDFYQNARFIFNWKHKEKEKYNQNEWN